MRWPWSRHKHVEGAAAAAAAARCESERKLADTDRLGGEVRDLSARLDAQLAENNFAALVAAAFRGHR